MAFPVPKGAGESASGTAWEGTHRWSEGQSESLKLTFKADGTIIYDSGFGAGGYSGTWKQEGAAVTWTVNNHATFTASIAGDKLEGTGSNKDGNKATVTYTRKESK